MVEPGGDTASYLRRARLGAGTAAVMASILALAAVLEAIDPEVAAEGCIALAAVVAIFYWLLRSGKRARNADPGLVMWQLGAVFLVLAALTYRTNASPVLDVLYVLAAFYGALRLPPALLYPMFVFGAIAQGVMLFMLIDEGRVPAMSGIWTQYSALVLAMGWIAFCAGAVTRLRERLAESARALHDLEEQARDRASRDALTGAYHRRHLMETLDREAARAQRFSKPLCVARLDIDQFRELNEALGPALGDTVLRRFVETAHAAKRDVDVFGRYGGKEFLVVMPDTDLAGAVIGGERLRNAITSAPFAELPGGRALGISCGIAQRRNGENSAHLLSRAEAALNFAKAAGRNRVIAVGEDGKPHAAEARSA